MFITRNLNKNKHGEIYWLPTNRIIALGNIGEEVVNGIIKPGVQLQFFPMLSFSTASEMVWQWSNELCQDDRIYFVIHLDEIETLLPALFAAVHTAPSKLPYIMLYLIVPEEESKNEEPRNQYLSNWIRYINKSVHRLVFVPEESHSDIVLECRRALMACMDVMPTMRGENANCFLHWLQPCDDMYVSYRHSTISLEPIDQRVTVDITNGNAGKNSEADIAMLVDKAMTQLLFRWRQIKPFLNQPNVKTEKAKYIFKGFTALISEVDCSVMTLGNVQEELYRYAGDNTIISFAIKNQDKPQEEGAYRLQLQGIIHTSHSLKEMENSSSNQD